MSEPRKSSAERRRGGCAARAAERNPSLSCENPSKSGFLAFPASPSSVAALSPKSSAKVRARPAPVLLVKFPEPWGLWAKMRKSSGWWRRGESNPRPHKSHFSFYARVPSLNLILQTAGGQAIRRTSGHEMVSLPLRFRTRLRRKSRPPTLGANLLHSPRHVAGVSNETSRH